MSEEKRRFEPDRPYCPHCKDQRWGYQHEMGICTDCGTEVMDRWPTPYYLKHLALKAVAGVFWILVLAGPVTYGIAKILIGLSNGRVLFGTRTVTTATTEVYGVLPEAGGAFALAVIIWLVLIFAVVGPRY